MPAIQSDCNDAYLQPETEAILISLQLRSKSVQTAGFKLYLFSKKPTTAYIDQGPIALDANDIKLLLGVVPIEHPDSDLGVTIYSMRDINIGLVGNNTLYGVLVAMSAVTFAGSDDISIALGL